MCRGLDWDGNAANFVETEQMVIEYNEENIKVCSYVQTWGSIPLLWSQDPDLKWEPKIKINKDNMLNEKAAKLHLTE